jgi:hypothetical protein
MDEWHKAARVVVIVAKDLVPKLEQQILGRHDPCKVAPVAGLEGHPPRISIVEPRR